MNPRESLNNSNFPVPSSGLVDILALLSVFCQGTVARLDFVTSFASTCVFLEARGFMFGEIARCGIE
jgi:hypothetical protein